MRCAGLLLWLFVQVQGQFEKQRSVVQAPLSAVQRRTASPVDAFGNPVPDSVAIPNIPRAKPPARVTSSAGYLELELVLETVDLQAECEVFRNDADDTEPSISCFKGSCVTLVKLASLKVDARYMFTMHSVRKVTDGVTGQVFEFHGPRSHPITFVTAGLPDWQLAIPETTSLGSIVMRLSWEEPNTGGSAILGYQVEMETNSQPGWQIIYDGQQDPSVKHLVLSNLTYGTTYFYNVYAINAIGRSQPISTAYTVAVPLEKTFFYPLSTDPSISRDPIPDFIIADVPTDLTIRAKNPVTEWFEVDSTHRNYLAAIHDACELNSERTLCLPVPEQHPDYQDHRQRLNQVPDCCYATVPNGDGTYSLNYTGNKTGIYSLMVYAIFANGLWGQYWDNAWFYGLPVLSKVDETISFEWGHHEVTALAGDHITARWVGFLLGPTTDEYTIYVKADDSVRVWFQGHLVVDYWDSSIPCCPELWTRQLLEKDRFYSIKVEWKEMQGNAQLRLMWGITGKRKQIIPGANLWRGAPLESAPFRILVHPGPPSTQTSGLLEPLEQLRTGASQRLYLQALDTMSNTVNSTDVQFEAYFYSPSYTNATVPLVFRSTPLMLQRREDHIHDHLHFIDLVLLEPGNYTLELFLKGHGQLASSPIHFLAVQDDIQPQMCTVVGPGSKEFIAGVETNFTLQLRDAFGNAVPHVDGVKVEVDLEFVEEIGPNLTYDDRRLRNLTGGHYATATSITKGESGSYFITYTGLRAGFNLLTIKVNGLVIMGHEEEVIYNPPVQGQNVPLQVTGFWNERANGLMTVFAPARLPAECTTGVICAVVFHLRDTYGNRMLGDYHDQLQYRTVDTRCNPEILEDPWCVPVDEGHCFQIEGLGEMHACELTPTMGGNYLLRLLVNGQDASYALWAESLGSFSLEDGTAYFRGPTAILVNIGEINATTSTMEGPGRLLEGNVVGVPQPLLVQLKDQYGNNRIVTGSDFQQRRNGIAATLGDRELDTIVYDNGTIEVTVLAIQAGYHNLRVRIGAGCLFVPVRDPCEDISGSPTALLWWKEAEVSENGMTCQTPYAMEAGRQYHFTCTGRDVFGNINRDHELKLTSFFNYVADPEGFEPPDGWFRGNLSENFNQTVAGSYLASDGRYHFDITLYRAGFYQLIIEMVKVGSEPAIVLASNVLAEGRPAGEATYVLGFPSLPSFMSSVVGGFVTAVANVANEVSVQTRDRFGNAVETASSAEVVAQLRGRSPVQLSLLHLIQGRYRGALVPFAAGPTLLEIRVAGEEIVGSPFDFLVTPGPMVTTLSLVEGFPSELTAGVLSCWNITLRDATENHLLSGQFAGDPTQLEPVTCSDPGSYCFHTQLNGTFTCCINKTSVEEVPANYLVDTFPFTCQIRGDNIFAPENIKLWPHPVSPYWPDSSLKIGSGMLGPYDYPTFINEQFGWKDWPTNYFRRVQNVDSGQPQHQWNRLRLWYTDGFYNVFKGDDAAILLCDVKGPHSLGVKTLGQPTRPLYRLPYTLDQELGVFEVELKFEKAGYHKVFCSTAARGGMNVEYRDTDGSTFRRVVEGVNISALDQLPVDEQGGSARWDALLYPPTSANYTLILVCRGRDAVLIFNSSLRVTISTTDDTVDQEQLAVIGPLDLQAQTAYSVQVAWTSHSLSSSVQLRWSSDGGIPETILPAEYLYNSKTLLSGYPKTVNVSDVPGPVEAFERVQPFQNGKIRLRWMPPLESNGRPISSYRLRHDDGLGGDFTKEVRVEVSFLTFSEVIPASFTEVEVPVPDSYGNIDSLLDPTKLYRFELRASNDDRADRDFQVDGGGISDQPVVIALQPVEKAGAPLKPVLVESQEHEDGTGFIRIRISPPRETSGGLMVQYRVYASYILDGVFPPLELWAEGSTPLETVDVTLTDLTVGRTYVFEVAYLFSQGESARSPPLELICCYAAIPQAPRNLRRKSDTGGLPVQTDDRITVIWDAPTFAGVRDITHYKVSLTPVVVLQSSEKLRSSEVLRNTRSADDREMQFDSLSAGQTYALRVAAVSGAGDGPWSEEVVMPASGYSTEPRDLHVALQSNSSIHFAWGEPLRVGAGGLRGYSIYANVSTLAAAPAPYLVGQTVAGQNSFSFTGYSYVATDGRLRNVGLIPGRLYEVFVVAENAAGVGPASVSSTISAVAASKPSAPQAFAVDLEALSQGVVDLSWQMPSTDGDSPIDAYRVQRMKEWPGTFLSQCSVLLNNLGEPGGNCVIGDFAANGVGDTDLIEENPGQVRIYTGRIAVRNVAREAQSSVLCSIDVFGDPLFPTAEYDPGRDEPPLRECYVLVEVCADEPGDWHDADSDSFDCGWYAAEPGRCEIFGVRSPGLWNRTASEACCACGGGLKTNELKFCTKEFGTCEFNSTIPAFGGLKADYTDGVTPVYFGKLESSVWSVADTSGVVECSRAIGGRAEVTGVSDIAFSTQQFCYIVEKDQGGWRELRSASTFSTDLFYSDVRAVLSHRYQYRVYATNEAVAGSVLATPEISIVTGGLPDPPETVVLGSDQMTVRIAWIEPPGQGLKVEGYRVYVDGKLAYDGATDSVTREFTLLNCTRGELRDLAVAAVNAGGETLVPTVITRHCARRPFKPEPPTIVYVDCVKEATPDRMLIDNHIRIAYKEPEDNGGVPLTGWRIQRAQGESLAFRGVGPLFPIPENEVWFDDFNDLDGAGKIGLVWGEIYKYRVVAVNDIDIWDDESASDYTIVRCSNEAPEVPWWLQLNASTTTTTTTAADNQTFAADLVTGFVWSVEATTTTTTLTAMESSYAFAKLADVDPRDCYLPQNVTEEPFNFSATIVEALEAFDPPPAPTLSVAWSACNTSVRKGDPCKEFFPDRSDVVACARLEFRPTQPANISCPVEWYEIERNEELIATVRPSQNGLVDAYTADTFTASHYDGFFGTRFTCFQTIPNRDLHDKQLYRIRAQNCRGWGAWSEELPVPVAAPPAPVCGLWGFTSDFQYTCTQPGLSVTPLNDTSAEFQWTLLQDAQLVDVANNFSRIQADIGQVGPGDFVTFSQQLIGSYDPRALLGYRLLLDDGLGGPFHLAYDGIGRRLTNTAKIFGLMPERTYRAFVRAVSFVGEGNASDMAYFKMAMPLPAPVNLSVSSVSLKSVMLTWKMPYAETADALPVSQYIVQMAMEPDFSNWFDVQNSPADNTEYSILVTQLEADFRYALRVMANSENGLGHTSESLYFWAGLLPNEGPRLVQRIESDAGTIKIQWERPGGAMLGTGTRMEAVTTDWGARGYMWDPAVEDPRLVFDGLGHADTVQFTVANATCGGQYKVAMTTVTTIGEGPFSTALDVTNARLPGVPRNVVITNTTTSSISIAWEEPEDTGCVPIHQYRILRYYPEAGFRVVGYATPADGLLQVPANRTYVDDGRCFFASPADDDGSCTCPPSCLQAGQLYRYQIQACVLGAYGVDTLELPEGPLGCGPNSNTVSAYAADLSEAPRDIRLGEPEGSQILLYWTAPSTDGLNGSSFTYEIEMDVGGVFTTLGLTTDTSFLISGLQLQFAYIFRISTYNSAGYVTRSNGIGYTATLPPAVPEPASPIPRSTWVSSAFFQHPSMASTPVPEGVSLRFSATAVNGYAWAMVVESSNLDMVSATTMKDGTYAVGGAACYRAQQAVARGEVYFWRLGSDDNPSDPTGCFLSHGGTYAIATYVQSVASFDAGLNDGTLSGPIEFTVVSGLSNTFYSSPTLNSPLTESGVTLAFTPRRPGYGWAMILTEEQARSATKEHVYRLDGALGGPFCRHGPRQLFANREEAWVFSGCLLTVGNRYTVLAYISGIGAHLDGTVDGASSTATSASNAFSTFPTISGPPSGDGITVQLRTRSSGYLWLMITVGPVALTIDLMKAGVGAVGASTCRVLAAIVDDSLQSFDLSDCKLNSGPEYALHSYIEGTTSSGNDGSFAGTVTFQVTPSNIFVVYPSIISETTGLGFTFQMTASFAGRFWLLLREGNAAITVEEIKSGTGALGLAECQRSSEVLTASLQELVLTNCQLSQDRLYSLYVYIEDFNGNGDGIIAGPISFYVLEANNFEDSPLPVENSATLDGVRLSFMASREGFAWAALFEDYAEALAYFLDVPTFLDRYYPTNNESCAPAGVPVLASGNITNMTLADCGLNYSATYWAVVYIEGMAKTKSGAISAPVEVFVPRSNGFPYTPLVLQARPYFVDVEVQPVRSGFLWIIVVHENHTHKVDRKAVKSGIVPSGEVVCGLSEITVNNSAESHRVEGCRLLATYSYHAFFYVEGPILAEEPDGSLEGPVLVWYNSSNHFLVQPRIIPTMTTNVFYFKFTPEVSGNFWAVVADNADEGFVTVWSIKSMQYGQPAADCRRDGKFVTGGLENTEEFLFCYFERGPTTYKVFIYLEDTNGQEDGIMETIGIIVPGSAEVSNEYLVRPYLVEPATIRGAKVYFQVRRTGYAWAGLIEESSWLTRRAVNNSNGNHADRQSIEIYDIMFFVDMVGSDQFCYYSAVPITANAGYTWEFLNCGLTPGVRYRLFIYVIGEEYWDVAVDPDAVFRSPFWNQWHRDNGRVSNGVLVVPPFSNSWAWPDGEPYISKGPHGMGLDVTFSTERPQALVWAIVQDATSTNFTINAVKTAQLAWGPGSCRQMGVPALDAAQYTLTLFGCSLLPAPKQYVLILYTEDQAVQNDGTLSDPIYFEVPVSNDFVIPPAVVGEAGLDTGISLSFEASSPGRVWLYLATAAQAAAVSVTIPNVKDALNAFDATNCMVAGLEIPASLQVITLPSCPLVYLSSYVVYVYVEDSNDHFDGTLATPLPINVGASNSFQVEPALVSVPTTDQVDFRFTPTKSGRAWVVVTPAASLVEPPTRSHMKASIGAVGALSCRVAGSQITPVEQTYALTGCMLDPGQIYALYAYVEDQRDRGDGTLSRIVFVKVIRSNNFAVSPVLLTTPTLDGFDVRFQAMVSGRAWAMAVDAIGGSGVTSLSIRSLQGALGGSSCQFQDFAIDADLQVWNFTDCRFQESKTYMIFIYIEAWPAVEGDGTLSGPMIASFFDASNVSADDTDSETGGEVLTVEEVPIVSNWFREDPRQSGPASPGGVTLTLRAAHASGRLWVMITRYRPQVAAESVTNGWNAIGGPGCQRMDAAIDEQEATVQLSECGLLRGRYYYAFAYVAGPEGGLNGTLSPPVEIFVPTVSNDFSQPPQLVATARQDHVQFTFSAVQQFGVAWVMIIDAWLAYSLTIESVKSFANAAGGSNCRREALSIGTAVKEILLASSFPNAGDGCDLTTNGMYVLAVYVEDINGLNDGTLAQLPVHISPRPTVSNRIAAGPVISANPTPSDVHLTFSAAIPGRYWAFILPTDRTNVFTLETAKFMDLNPDTVGQAGCRKNDVEMGSGATEVHLTDCDLVMSGPGITFYSAFIYVEDNSGQVGDLSAAVTVVGISNTFLPPFPRIVAFETDGKISVDVRVNNSGRLWSRIVYSDLYPSIERYSGAMSLTVLKQWQDYPDNGPSYQNENCSIFELDVTAERDFEGLPVPVWLNFSNCTFTSGTNYMIAIYAEDAGGNNDGEIIGLKLDKYYNASNYFIASPSVVGTAMAETFTVQFQTWAAGFGWCAIISPQDAKYLTGAAVMSGEASLGGPNCCKNSAGFLTGGGLETLTLTGCGLSMDTEYLFFMYISGGALDGTLSSGHAFTTFGSLGHIRVQWLQKETDEGGAIDRYRVFLNGTQVYDDYGYRSSLEQARAGSPPRWVRVADLACTPGLSYEVTLSGRNLGGWSPLSEPLQTGCFLRPGTISELREVSSSVSADRETASLRLAWNAPQDAAGAETAYYNVYRDRGLRQALFELIGSTAVTQFDDSGLVPGRDYGYQVTAVNAFGEGPVSDVLFLKVAGTPVIETPKVDLLGILNQAGLQMTPTAQTGELDQVDGILQVYSSDRPRTLQALNYVSHRAAHLVVFGPVALTVEEVDLAGTTAEGDPCLEAELEIAAPAVSMQFCAGDSDSAPSISLAHGELATIFWRTGQLSSPPTETGRWRIGLHPVP